MNKKICFITGANSGIGKATAVQLAERGYVVLIGARNESRGLQAVADVKEMSSSETVELVQIDLSLKASISHAVKEIKSKFDHLDVLIHNAADFDVSRKAPVLTAEGVESIWATNHIGPVLLTNGLLDLLKNSKQGRIIMVASQGLMLHPRMKVDLNDPEYQHRKFSVAKAYYQSKLAQVMYTYWLAKKLSDTAVTVNCIRVTNVKIDLNRYPDLSALMKFLYSIKSKFSISPEQMAETYTYLADDPAVSKTTGKYFNEKNEMVDSSAYSKEEKHWEELMELTKGYVAEGFSVKPSREGLSR
ncbi:SDR family NAD(P)-dependent oxidoreductase [Persicobacter psychrovividus]|uniref:Dehydrogenase n=1 Tax=Persicobacter psychrovividus TaxID=387638 RepID=A0ABM7VC28_9BACT|nr:dehydrogenase [Persicobacter psychrovividus]